MGMGSVLGPVITACAAFRAGIVRPRSSVDVTTFSPGDGEPQPVTVYDLPASTFGFVGVGRLIAITLEALTDLSSHMSLQTLGKEVGVFLALPDFTDGSDARISTEFTDQIGRQLLERALHPLGLSWPQERWHFFTGGSAGFALALDAARRAMERRSMEICVVGGVDSRTDPTHLRNFLHARRLKTKDNPVGLIPGEAGALVVLRARPSGRSRESANRTVSIASIHLEQEPHPLDSKQRPNGLALATCVESVLETLPNGGNDPLLICDLNGEERRAWEWGCALVRLLQTSRTRESMPAWTPALGFGDVGAASGAVGACLAIRGLQRGYARANHIIVVSQSDSGRRAAFAVAADDVKRSRGAP